AICNQIYARVSPVKDHGFFGGQDKAGISLFPDEDNWACVKFLEGIAATELKW
ncbi:unnamed protein product, partial [marine sediment metagenome]